MAEIERTTITPPSDMVGVLKAEIDRGLTDLTEGRVQEFDAARIIRKGKELLARR